ncbi:MAG: PilZ domain-containing protein [Nitrospirae bacterium]|nr:PilZ domain-containing protein [Nitrospirota bacterium]MBI3594963.1 PilZ domain-containing protein [Nitrospirota bacterium]
MDNTPFNMELDTRFGTRIPYNQEVLINKQTFGTIRDISASGCFIETKKIYGLGQDLMLKFYLISPIQASVETKARVVNIKPGEGVGVKFTFETEKPALIVKQFIDALLHKSK